MKQNTEQETKRPIRCSICNEWIEEWPPGWFEGHNAWPVNDGRCCTKCNDTVVIPTRLGRLFGTEKDL